MDHEIAIFKGIEISKISEARISKKDVRQVKSALQVGNFEMATSFLWSKAVYQLKKELSKLGDEFIAELTGRHVDDVGSVQQFLTDYEAIKLCGELGYLNKHEVFQLRQSVEILWHYESLGDEGEESLDSIAMSEVDAAKIVEACFKSIMVKDQIDGQINFKKFLDKYENEPLALENPFVQQLIASPYFYKKTFISIVCSKIKTLEGAKVENVLANSLIVIPNIWDDLNEPEKDTFGKLYRDVYTEDNKKATSGIKKILLEVNGFDYVPETLRSNSFILASKAIIRAHFGMNNFYNEPKPMMHLSKMGKVPRHALADSLTATLIVKVGNRYGVSGGAQIYADSLLERISPQQWIYFLEGRLFVSNELMSELLTEKQVKRFSEVIETYGIEKQLFSDNRVKKLINACALGDYKAALKILKKRYGEIQEKDF